MPKKKSEEAHSPKTSEPVPYGSTYKQLTTKNMRWGDFPPVFSDSEEFELDSGESDED